MPYKTETIEPGTELLTVNMGPSHPATHGVLRLILTLDGEGYRVTAYKETEQYRTMKGFLDDPEEGVRRLFAGE